MSVLCCESVKNSYDYQLVSAAAPEPAMSNSSHLASDWARLGNIAEQHSGNIHLDHFIEGPLAEIEAARKALHSPSLVNNRNFEFC